MKKYQFIKVKRSNNEKYKYEAIFKNRLTGKEKTIKFGAKGMEHYTSGHLDEKRKKLYIMRHNKRENWDNPLTAGYWSFRYNWLYKTHNEASTKIKNDLKRKGYL